MKKKILGIFVVALLIATVLPVTGSINAQLNEESKVLTPKMPSEGMSAQLCFAPKSHDFGAVQEGITLQTQFEIWNCGALPSLLEWHLGIIDPEISPSPMNGQSSGEHDTITVTVDTSGLATGEYEFRISIYSDGGDGTFTVRFEVVTGTAILGFDPSWYYEYVEQGETFQTTFEIFNLGSGILDWHLGIIDPEISPSPMNGQSSGEHDTITVTLDTSGLTPGEYEFRISIYSDGGDGTFTVFLEVLPDSSMILSSSAFENGGIIPVKYTCDAGDGIGVSPPLTISNIPAGTTQSLALVMYDEDAIPVAQVVWVHWIVYAIPTGTTISLPENAGASGSGNLPSGAKHGTNTDYKQYYQGPCPPLPDTHKYYFKIYALDIDLTIAAGIFKPHLLAIIDDHVVAVAKLMGTYSRGGGNQPPNQPTRPDGSTNGKTGESYRYESFFSDPDGDSMEVLFDWGDGTDTGWLGPIASGTAVGNFHTWSSQGTYQVRTRARDLPHQEMSDWSDPLSVSMPRNRAIHTQFIKFMENHPILFQLFQRFLQL